MKRRKPEQKRNLEKKKAIEGTNSRFEACKSNFSFTSANQLKKSQWESSVVSSREFFNITPRMIKILQILKTVNILPKAQKILERDSEIPRTTFYRLIKKLESYGFISHIPNTYPKMEKLHPDIENLLSQNPEGISLKNGKVGKCESEGNFSKSQTNDRELKSNSEVPRKNSPISKPTNNNPSFDKRHFPKNANNRGHSLYTSTSPRESNPNDEFDDRILRSHNYFFKIPIQRKPAYLERMLSKTIWFEQRHMKNWSYFQGKLSLFGCEAIIQFNPNVVTVWLNNVFGRNSHENNLEADRRILEIKGYLEDCYVGLYLAPHIFLRRVENKGIEHGWIHHHLSLKAKQQNISLKGRNWEIDSSKDMPELEANNNLLASEHLMEELEDYDYRSENGVYFRDLHSNQKKHLELINNIQNIQKEIWNEIKRSRSSTLQERILEFLQTNKGFTRKEISKQLSIKIGSVNGTISRLKKKKLIREVNSRLYGFSR